MHDDAAAAHAIGLEAIRSAQVSGAPIVKRTPVLSSVTMGDLVGGTIALKAENLQRTGSFKVRGALHRLHQLGPAAARGVTAGSAGNHAQALALAAKHHGVDCRIFVPEGAPLAKIEACEGYGATVTEAGASLTEAVAASREHAAESGSAFCHPYDDPDVVAGQGTLGLELVEDIDDLRAVIVPLGGGGLCAGVATAVRELRSGVRIVGVQASVCAPFLGDPPPEGPVPTLADGIAVKSPGTITRPIIERLVDDIVAVDEDTIGDAMLLLSERAKLLVEGAGAVGIAALLEGSVTPAPDGVTCVVLSGGNVDLGEIPSLILRHETLAGRRITVFVRIDDRPGGLARLLGVCASVGANVIDVQHVREGVDLHVRETGLRATFEIRNPRHGHDLVASIADAGYPVAIDSTGS